MLYTDGCKLQGTKTDGLGRAGNLSEAVSVAARADVVVLCLGLSAEIEGEQGDASNSEAAGDKVDLKLPGLQQRMMEMIVALGKPTVLCVLAGSALDLTWAQDHVPAIVYAWYPGGEGGAALADVLFGDVSPAGRLPITFPRSLDDVPDFKSYAMKGRTYRYAEKTPLYPFGYGLSYTRFAYRDVAVSSARVRAGRHRDGVGHRRERRPARRRRGRPALREGPGGVLRGPACTTCAASRASASAPARRTRSASTSRRAT